MKITKEKWKKNIMKKKINGYADMIRYTLNTFEKQIKEVEDSTALNMILEEIQRLYHKLEDITMFAYRNKGGIK